MKIKVIVFDLDDTLYDEINFVKSGFKAVCSYFSLKYKLNEELFYSKMIEFLDKDGRGKVFDNVLEYFDIFNKTNVKRSISLYRTHIPKITLKKEAIAILEHFNSKNIPLYLVTDGNKLVQYNKILALDIEKYLKKAFITHRYGIQHSKPSPYCFLKIAKNEKVNNSDIVYIGDNVNKDFVGIKPLGFRTIKIENGMFKNAIKSDEYQAEYNIKNLDELKNIIRKQK